LRLAGLRLHQQAVRYRHHPQRRQRAMQRRMLESEIHSSAEKVHELLGELQNQRVEEQIAKTRGDIYASIIHDINGPLTVISGFIQLLNKKLNRNSRLEVEDLEFIKERMRIIERQVATASRFRGVTWVFCASKPAIPPPGVNQLLSRPRTARARASQHAGK
jgi:signal transduction histidine kinase